MPANKNLLLIFTRNPEFGKVKKRLAASIGDSAALEIYTSLLQHTAEITRKLPVDKEVCYSEKTEENDSWDDKIYNKRVQKGKDLGERMKNAFQAGFAAGYTNIIIIGSDLYDLNQEDLQKAFGALRNSDYVIGPALDGGYYLLGMKSMNAAVFVNKPWSTKTVFQETLKDLNEKEITLLDTRNDIDYVEDLKDHPVFHKYLK